MTQRLGLHLLEPLASRACDAILFQNPDDMASWSSLFGVPHDRATLVGNGLDVAAFERRLDRSARFRIRGELKIPDDAFVIAVVARFESAKGHGHFLASLRALVDRPGPPVVALLVGRGEDEANVRAQVDRLGLEDAVRFTGYRNDVPDLLVASDVSVLTSLYEGIPRALMEAMVVGLPVVATDVPGTRTLVAHGVTGFLSAPGDVESFAINLQRLRSEPATSTELGVNGRRRVESRFDESAVTDRVLTIYEHVRARTPGPLPRWDPAEPEEAASESV